jgi:hypothetical protein
LVTGIVEVELDATVVLVVVDVVVVLVMVVCTVVISIRFVVVSPMRYNASICIC